MEIPWKMQWTGYLLLTTCLLITLTSSTPIPESSDDPKTDEKKEDKKTGDLDLETQDQVAILKQINRVNEDGSYTFGYEAADGSFKIETRDVNGNVKGMFGFINEDGDLKRISYSASNGTGFQASGTFNVPSLPGTRLSSEEDTSGQYGNIPPGFLQSRSYQAPDTSTRIALLPPSTTSYDDRTTELIPTPRLPIYIFSTTPTATDVTTTARPVVIQHIPKVRPTPATSTTVTTESEEVNRKTTFGTPLPKKTSNTNYVTLRSNDITTEATEEDDDDSTKKPSVIQVIRPRTGPYKKVIVTKRPVAETTTPKAVTTTEFYSREYLQRLKENNQNAISGVRRQLDYDNNYVTTPENTNLVTSGTEDSPDVYGGTATPRPYSTIAYRTLFNQIPQHQRILQNSYIQNQNQFLASFPGRVPPPGLSPLLPGQGQPPMPPRVLPAPSVLPDAIGTTNSFNTRFDAPRPVEEPSTPYPIPSQPLNRVIPNAVPIQPNYISPSPLQHAYTNPTPLQPAYTNPNPLQPSLDPYSQQLYIPPGLLDNLIRMLLSLREHQLSNPPMISPVASRNLSPELMDNRYTPYPQSAFPYPNYSQTPYPLPLQYIPRSSYDPRLSPFPSSYNPVPFYNDPRVNTLQSPNTYRPVLFGPLQSGRVPLQPEPLPLRPVLGGRPLPPQQTPNVASTVERSVPYGQRIPDSTTSSTTTVPRLGSVRNVQILNPTNEDGEDSEKFQRDVKSTESS